MRFTSALTTVLPTIGDSTVEETRGEQRPNEERVVQLLSERGGRLWQTDVVAETGWSESKTSEVLCRMERRGRITRYQRGRQKVVLLPNSVPDFLDESER